MGEKKKIIDGEVKGGKYGKRRKEESSGIEGGGRRLEGRKGRMGREERR